MDKVKFVKKNRFLIYQTKSEYKRISQSKLNAKVSRRRRQELREIIYTLDYPHLRDGGDATPAPSYESVVNYVRGRRLPFEIIYEATASRCRNKSY